MLVEAYRIESLKAAWLRLAQSLSWLDRNGEDDAASSLREGMEETLTVWKLAVRRLGGGHDRSLRPIVAATPRLARAHGIAGEGA
jgi:hypothetical protein